MVSSKVKNINAEEAYNLIKENRDVVILDVRSKEEYDNGHIPGAKLVPVQVLSTKLTELSEYKDKPVLVYCASGGRSPRAVDSLVNNDFKDIYHLVRGLSSWRYNEIR